MPQRPGGGKAGAVLSLKEQTTPYPLQADVRFGAVRIAIEGQPLAVAGGAE